METIIVKNGELRGTGALRWIENDGFNAPHWAVFVSVPFQDCKREYIGGRKDDSRESLEKAVEIVEARLDRCGLV